jgi:hypothetical protein
MSRFLTGCRAFVEAANLAQRRDTACRKYCDRKKAQANVKG